MSRKEGDCTIAQDEVSPNTKNKTAEESKQAGAD